MRELGGQEVSGLLSRRKQCSLLLNCCIIRQDGGEALLFSSVEGMGRIQ